MLQRCCEHALQNETFTGGKRSHGLPTMSAEHRYPTAWLTLNAAAALQVSVLYILIRWLVPPPGRGSDVARVMR